MTLGIPDEELPMQQREAEETKQWRSSCFMHSDAEDVIDRAANEALGYHPKSRVAFLKVVLAELKDLIDEFEETHGSED